MVRGGSYDAVAEACELAPEMDTVSRVDMFGSEKLIDILHSGLRGDIIAFQTEYECMFVDEAESYFTLELLTTCVDKRFPIWKRYPEEGYTPLGDISIGVDLAKEIDSTVFTVVDHYEEEGVERKKVVFIYATRADYEDQFNELKRLVAASGARRVSIDATGPGQMFFEKAEREGFGANVIVEGISFTNAKKEAWATKFKGDLQTETVSYPNHSELLDQIHGIKRTKTTSNFYRFAGKKDDYFWSLMLALYGEGTRPVRFYKIGW